MMTSKTFKETLEAKGMASTRSASLVRAIDQLHSSVGAMDRSNLSLMWNEYSGLMEVLVEYARHSRCLNTFEDYKP